MYAVYTSDKYDLDVLMTSYRFWLDKKWIHNHELIVQLMNSVLSQGRSQDCIKGVLNSADLCSADTNSPPGKTLGHQKIMHTIQFMIIHTILNPGLKGALV